MLSQIHSLFEIRQTLQSMSSQEVVGIYLKTFFVEVAYWWSGGLLVLRNTLNHGVLIR